eukprot:COSAG06_NODE_8452_length_2170_cov_4.020280_1_plen_167_part_10
MQKIRGRSQKSGRDRADLTPRQALLVKVSLLCHVHHEVACGLPLQGRWEEASLRWVITVGQDDSSSKEGWVWRGHSYHSARTQRCHTRRATPHRVRRLSALGVRAVLSAPVARVVSAAGQVAVAAGDRAVREALALVRAAGTAWGAATRGSMNWRCRPMRFQQSQQG